MESNEWDKLLARAEAGDAEAQYMIGICCYSGDEVERDYIKAHKYLKLAADQGHVEALFPLAVLYAKGWGVRQNQEKSSEYLQLAANLGDTLAQTYLNRDRFEEIESEAEYNRREKLQAYIEAADQGDPKAQVYVGLSYLRGADVEQDTARACEYLNKASGNGIIYADFLLGIIYSDEKFGCYRPLDAEKLLNIAIQNNYGEARIYLAELYLSDTKTQLHAPQSVKLLKQAIKSGYYYAYGRLGDCYANGWGIAANREKARDLYSRAISHGYNYAYIGLGKCLLVDNTDEAVECLETASAADFMEARILLAEIYSRGKYVPRDISKGIYYYRLALALDPDNEDVRYNLELLEASQNAAADNSINIRSSEECDKGYSRSHWGHITRLAEFDIRGISDVLVQNIDDKYKALQAAFPEYYIESSKYSVLYESPANDRKIYQAYRKHEDGTADRDKELVIKAVTIPADHVINSVDYMEIESRLEELKWLLEFRDNPNVIRTYEYVLFDNNLYIPMEKLVPLDTYIDVADPDSIDEDFVIKLAMDICNALKELSDHNPPIVHRDIKPSNIYVDEKGGIPVFKLGDFGISAQIGDVGMKLSCSTPLYKAPENFVDVVNDIFSLGLLLYQVANGGRLSEEDIDLESRESCLKDEKRPELLSDKMWKLLKQMTMCNPLKRIGLDQVIISCRRNAD